MAPMRMLDTLYIYDWEGRRVWHGVWRTDKDTDEGETFLPEVEAVDIHKDDGERFEPDVEETVDEGYVKV